MSRGESVPITGSVLEWAIRESGLTEEDVALRLKVSPDLVQAWLQGQEQPNKTQFAGLAEYLKRPSAIFFMPSPPSVPSVQANFRRAPGEEKHGANRAESRWIRTAHRLQEAASWVLQQENAAPIEVHFRSMREHPVAVAQEERARLGVRVSDQIKWAGESAAFKGWRDALESLGVLVLRFEMGAQASRGFSSWDDFAPAIVVNTANSNAVSRAYTMFHEYAHLLLRADSVCENYRPRFDLAVSSDIERWCESFAAALLLPRNDLEEYLERHFPLRRSGHRVVDFEGVKKIAGRYKVSLRATALRLIDLEASPSSLYSTVDQLAAVPAQRKGGGQAMPRSQRRLQEYGRRLSGVLLEALDNEVLDLHSVLDYMDMDYGQLDDLRSMLPVG